MSYRVKTVSAMTGIPRATLLAWERRYAILDPNRSPSGYREYSDADVALLQRLKALVDAGHPVGEAVALTRPVDAPQKLRVETNLRERLLGALAAWDRTAVDRLSAELATVPFGRAVDDIYLPMLERIGEDWASGRISVAQEHFASAWVREQMLSIFHAIGGGPVAGPRVVCAMAPGELHELGLLAVAIKLALAGFRVFWLGADLPIDQLVDAVRGASPRLVCMSVVMPTPHEQIRAYARRLRAEIAPDVLVAVGGPASAGLEQESAPGLLFGPSFETLETALAAMRRSAP